jgi:hypothetical protein
MAVSSPDFTRQSIRRSGDGQEWPHERAVRLAVVAWLAFNADTLVLLFSILPSSRSPD